MSEGIKRCAHIYPSDDLCVVCLDNPPSAPTAVPRSGYTPCACRDCMDVTVSADMSNPELCELCTDAGCEWYRPGSGEYESLPAHMRECQRDDAYGAECVDGDDPCSNACQCGCESGAYECSCADAREGE